MLEDPEIKKEYLDYICRNFGHLHNKWDKTYELMFSQEKIIEEIDAIQSFFPQSTDGLNVLEIGSGNGLFCALARKKGMVTLGIEPDHQSIKVAQYVGNYFGLGLKEFPFCEGWGEHLPIKGNQFDLVCSFYVLEHTHDPEAVLRESIRVLKPNGLLYFIIPNYRFFWEGHYRIFWFPFLNRKTARYWVRLFKKPSSFLNQINFVTIPWLKKTLSKIPEIQTVSFGEDVWIRRMTSGNLGVWGNQMALFAQIVKILNIFNLSNIVAKIGIRFHCIEPIILIIRKS